MEVVGKEGNIWDGECKGGESQGKGKPAKGSPGKDNFKGGGAPNACPQATSPSAEDSADDGR